MNDWAYVGLLTDAQKRMGLFVAQDDDFVYLLHRGNGNPKMVAVFDYEIVTIKEIRQTADAFVGDNG